MTSQIKALFIDLESGPLPADQIQHLMPEFKAPANYKSEEAIKANIDAQRSKWLADAALSPITGEILAVGLMTDTGTFSLIEGPEPEILTRTWKSIQEALWANVPVIGWCIHHFDLPYLVKRSWRAGVAVPACIRGGTNMRYWCESIMDLQVYWQLGDNRAPASLDVVSKFLGLPGKNGDGAQFAETWRTNKPQAVEYLKNDLELTRQIYGRTLLSM